MKKDSYLFLAIFTLILAAAGAFGYFYLRGVNPFNQSDDAGLEESEDLFKGGPSGIGYRAKEELPPYPEGYDSINYDNKILLSEISPDNRKKQEDIFKSMLEKIEKNPDTLEFWINLGLVKKIFGDYKGARDVWEYASLIRPQNSVSFANLGDLYRHFIPDFPKAEENFKKALENMPSNLALYKDLSDLYRFDYKEKSNLADDILLEGLEANPDNISILLWLGAYYRDTGDVVKARTYFEKALGQMPGDENIRMELENL